jgi:hypothetical protein
MNRPMRPSLRIGLKRTWPRLLITHPPLVSPGGAPLPLMNSASVPTSGMTVPVRATSRNLPPDETRNSANPHAAARERCHRLVLPFDRIIGKTENGKESQFSALAGYPGAVSRGVPHPPTPASRENIGRINGALGSLGRSCYALDYRQMN